MSSNTVYKPLFEQRVLPLFYHDDASVCVDRMQALYEAGIRVIEFTNRGQHAAANFAAMIKMRDASCPDLQLGVGTIYNWQQAELFVQAGAAFLVSPIFSDEVCREAALRSIPYIPGCMTPQEVHLAATSGCSLVKIFPASVMGAGYIRSLRELFPAMQFMPSGGIDIAAEPLLDWFNAGASVVGIGSPLFKGLTMESELKVRVAQILQSIQK
jgi:2-dehydro-3-deoxyphosphogluconate aldolase/(4S)-4-hydroxy-2-oxoglutarate aldolase